MFKKLYIILPGIFLVFSAIVIYYSFNCIGMLCRLGILVPPTPWVDIFGPHTWVNQTNAETDLGNLWILSGTIINLILFFLVGLYLEKIRKYKKTFIASWIALIIIIFFNFFI